MSQLTVLDENQIMGICKTEEKLRTFWCYHVPEIPSLSFLQLGKKINHPENKNFQFKLFNAFLQTYLVIFRQGVFIIYT